MQHQYAKVLEERRVGRNHDVTCQSNDKKSVSIELNSDSKKRICTIICTCLQHQPNILIVLTFVLTFSFSIALKENVKSSAYGTLCLLILVDKSEIGLIHHMTQTHIATCFLFCDQKSSENSLLSQPVFACIFSLVIISHFRQKVKKSLHN